MRKLLFGLLFLALMVTISSDQVSAATTKEWTFLVYMDGDNDLEPFVLSDFMEMAAVGTNDKINMVVQLDRCPGYSTAYGNWTNTRRFLINKGDNPSVTPTQSMGELNMGDKNVLKDFIVWGVTNYPANRYVLVLWNHGGGWRNKVRGTTRARAICWDETSNDACLFMRDVKSAMQMAQNSTGRRMNIIGFDACLMGMIEVANDMQGVADFMIGSEETEPGDGWFYTPIMTKLTANPSMATRDLAKLIVEEYHASYSGKETAITQAATDLSKIPALNTALKNFVNVANQWSYLKDARSATRTYSEGDGYPHADLVHFMKNIKAKGATDPAVLSAADAVIAAVQASIVVNKYGSARTNSNGLAIYFPKTQTQFNSAYGNEYASSSNNAATNWGSFLTKFLNPPADNATSGTGGTTVINPDGTGSVTVSRKTPVPAGKNVTSVTFTFKAGESISGGQIRLDIPSTWTKPTTDSGMPGAVSVKFGTGQSGVIRVSGYSVYVDCDVLAKGRTVKIYYKKFMAPAGSSGLVLFKVLSKGAGGRLKEIAASPTLTVN